MSEIITNEQSRFSELPNILDHSVSKYIEGKKGNIESWRVIYNLTYENMQPITSDLLHLPETPEPLSRAANRGLSLLRQNIRLFSGEAEPVAYLMSEVRGIASGGKSLLNGQPSTYYGTFNREIVRGYDLEIDKQRLQSAIFSDLSKGLFGSKRDLRLWGKIDKQLGENFDATSLESARRNANNATSPVLRRLMSQAIDLSILGELGHELDDWRLFNLTNQQGEVEGLDPRGPELLHSITEKTPIRKIAELTLRGAVLREASRIIPYDNSNERDSDTPTNEALEYFGMGHDSKIWGEGSSAQDHKIAVNGMRRLFVYMGFAAAHFMPDMTTRPAINENIYSYIHDAEPELTEILIEGDKKYSLYGPPLTYRSVNQPTTR